MGVSWKACRFIGSLTSCFCFFHPTSVTTIELEDDEPNIFGVSDGIQALFNTGLLGALITTICASITWQLVASAFPMAFLSTPITYVFMRFCLFLEWTGLCKHTLFRQSGKLCCCEISHTCFSCPCVKAKDLGWWLWSIASVPE